MKEIYTNATLHWGVNQAVYNFKQHGAHNAAPGGNLLMNVTQKPDGTIDDEARLRLSGSADG